MAIRLSGMSSGMDTESIVAELVKLKSEKKTKLEGEQKKLKWKQEAWKELNTKIYAFYSKKLSNMRLTSDFSKKTTSSSNSAVSVVTGSNAPNCVQTMNITKMAKAGYLTGAKLQDVTGKSDKYTADTKLVDELGIAAGSSFTISVNGKSKEITIDESTTINNVVTAMRDAGVNANFDEVNQRFYISSKDTGKANDFTITANDTAGLTAMSKLGIASSLDADVNTKELYHRYADALAYTTIDGETVIDRDAVLGGRDTDGDGVIDVQGLQSIVDAEVAKRAAEYKQKIEDANAKIEKLQGKLAEEEATFNNTYLSGGVTKTVTKSVTNEDGSTTETEELVAETDVDKIKEAIDALDWDNVKKTDEEYAAMTDEEKTAYDALKEQYNTYTKQLADAEGMVQIKKEITEQNVAIAEAEVYYEPGVDGAEGTAKETLIRQVENDTFAQAEEYKAMLEVYATGSTTMNAIRIAGQDSEIVLNGATYTSERNTYTINDLTITINNYTDEEITLSTTEDTSGIYDMIKDFFKEYNELINEIDKLYNADSASKYTMLTDEEREALSEEDAKEWDEKIKGALLRKDSSLSTVFESFKTIMLSGVEMSDGTKMYLSNFGIGTAGYFGAAEHEKNAYHIDGDEDDSVSGTNTDKLKAAIANDPEQVAEFFSKLARNLYEKLDDLMKSTDYSSAFTVYNDKALEKEYKNFSDKIKDQEEKIADYEDRYYDKFTAMEVAMSKLTSQQSSLSSLFGA